MKFWKEKEKKIEPKIPTQTHSPFAFVWSILLSMQRTAFVCGRSFIYCCRFVGNIKFSKKTQNQLLWQFLVCSWHYCWQWEFSMASDIFILDFYCIWTSEWFLIPFQLNSPYLLSVYSRFIRRNCPRRTLHTNAEI